MSNAAGKYMYLVPGDEPLGPELGIYKDPSRSATFENYDRNASIMMFNFSRHSYVPGSAKMGRNDEGCPEMFYTFKQAPAEVENGKIKYGPEEEVVLSQSNLDHKMNNSTRVRSRIEGSLRDGYAFNPADDGVQIPSIFSGNEKEYMKAFREGEALRIKNPDSKSSEPNARCGDQCHVPSV